MCTVTACTVVSVVLSDQPCCARCSEKMTCKTLRTQWVSDDELHLFVCVHVCERMRETQWSKSQGMSKKPIRCRPLCFYPLPGFGGSCLPRPGSLRTSGTLSTLPLLLSLSVRGHSAPVANEARCRYCQGMGMVAALLLLHMEEVEAFWALIAVTSALLPGGPSVAPWTCVVPSVRGLGDLSTPLYVHGHVSYRSCVVGGLFAPSVARGHVSCPPCVVWETCQRRLSS